MPARLEHTRQAATGRHDRRPRRSDEPTRRRAQRAGRRQARLPVRQEPRRRGDPGHRSRLPRRQPGDLVVVPSSATTRSSRSSAIPDASGLGPESGYVPPVADSTRVAGQPAAELLPVAGRLRRRRPTLQLKGITLPVPELPVGRLVETPAEITGDDRRLPRPTASLDPTSSLVTGYDFLTDAADAVQGAMSAAFGADAETLITNQGVAPTRHRRAAGELVDGRPAAHGLLGSGHDIIYLAGHFSANNLLAADYSTTMNATEVAASTVDLSNALVFSAGCHSGYTVVDGDVIPNVTQSLDWMQAFAQKRATVVAGTGYQYGDTDFLEYSERLYRDFTNALRVGSGPVRVGSALVAAKQQYLAETPTLGGIHQKALLEATLYGLPMSAVNLPAPAGSLRRRTRHDRARRVRRRTRARRSGSARPTCTRDWAGTTSRRSRGARQRRRQPDWRHGHVVQRAERRRHQPRRARRAARHRRRQRPRQGAARRRLPRRLVHRPRRDHAAHRRAGDGAEHARTRRSSPTPSSRRGCGASTTSTACRATTAGRRPS